MANKLQLYTNVCFFTNSARAEPRTRAEAIGTELIAKPRTESRKMLFLKI